MDWSAEFWKSEGEGERAAERERLAAEIARLTAEAFWKNVDGEVEGAARLAAEIARLTGESERLAAEAFAGFERRRKAEYEKADKERGNSDLYALQAADFRNNWIATRSRIYGSFEDTTKIPPMRFTDKPAPPHFAHTCDTLQVFSVKVAGIRGGLHWPLRVFGIVAVRDKVDYNRNVIFHRTRDNCQTLTGKDPFLVLTGPTRAVWWLDRVRFEAVLKVKGAVESEDTDLSFLAVPISAQPTLYPYLLNRNFTSILSTLEVTIGHILYSVEATIFVRVLDGLWPDKFDALFAASTTSIDHKKFVLFYSNGEKIVLTDDGNIELSRSVASVEIEGKLKISVRAWAASGVANNALENELACTPNELAASRGDNNDLEGESVAWGGAIDAVEDELVASHAHNNVVQDELVFTPKEYGRSYGTLDIGFCKMEVTIAWSYISTRAD